MSKFAVALEQPGRNDERKFKYETAEQAEQAARRYVTGRGGEMSIWVKATRDSRSMSLSKAIEAPTLQVYARGDHVATVIRDALDRVWTQVSAAPGQRCFL